MTPEQILQDFRKYVEVTLEIRRLMVIGKTPDIYFPNVNCIRKQDVHAERLRAEKVCDEKDF